MLSEKAKAIRYRRDGQDTHDHEYGLRGVDDGSAHTWRIVGGACALLSHPELQEAPMNNRTQQRGRGNNQSGSGYNALVPHEPRLPMPRQELLAPYGIDQSKWQALTDAIFPSAKTVPGVMLALAICKARKLDVFKRVVHIVPMWSSKHGCEIETIWPGIAEARITATRTGVYAGRDGVKFGRIIRRAFEATKSGSGQSGPYSNTVRSPEMEYPETAQITVYKIVGGVRCPFVGPEVSFVEMFSGQKGMRVPNDRWQQAPRQMLEKCAEAAALRAAFPEEFGNELFAEEMDGKTMHGDIDGRGVVIEQAQQSGIDQPQEPPQQAEDADFEDAGDDVQRGEPQFWDKDQVDAFREYVAAGLAQCRTARRVEKALADQAESMDKLAPDDRKSIKAMFDARRAELTGKPAENDGRSADQERQDGEKPEERSGTAGNAETPFLRNLRRDIEEIDTEIELSAYESGLRRQLEAEAPDIAGRARAVISARREQLGGQA